MEALCATEAVWKSADGKGLSRDRVNVLMILTKHTAFTNDCREFIASWKDKELQATLEKELPWTSVGVAPKIAMLGAEPKLPDDLLRAPHSRERWSFM